MWDEFFELTYVFVSQHGAAIVIDRLADALGFEIPRPDQGPRTAFVLTTLGYGAGVLPG